MAKEARRWNSKLNSKGLESFVSEQQAGEMCRSQGNTYIFVVQAHAGPKVVNEDGSEVVNLIPDLVELVPPQHEELMRRFHRSLRAERPDMIGQATIESISDVELSSDDVAAEVAANTVDVAEPGPNQEPWDGNPDTPTNQDVCPHPDCSLTVDHDGDHDPLTGADLPIDQPNVVAFTHKG